MLSLLDKVEVVSTYQLTLYHGDTRFTLAFDSEKKLCEFAALVQTYYHLNKHMPSNKAYYIKRFREATKGLMLPGEKMFSVQVRVDGKAVLSLRLAKILIEEG